MTTVIWIDWYAYHVSRLRALVQHGAFEGGVTGIELVGGCGVHQGLKFREDDRGGLPIISLFPLADWQRMDQMKLARAVWRKLNELSPSSVLIPGFYTLPGLVAALWTKWNAKRSVLMSETTYGDSVRVWWKELPKSLLVRALFDYGIAGGNPHVRYLRKLGLPEDRIARCYDVVDNKFYADAAAEARLCPRLREELGLPKDYFLYVGRLAPEKNLTGLLMAFANCVRYGGRSELVLIGDGPDRARLESECKGLGIAEVVHFEGLKKTREIPPYYAFARCFVLPSTREPWGLVANEAMASSLPVIISARCGCAEDLVEPGVNGYRFNHENLDELTDHLLAMSAADECETAAMGRRSWEIIQNYSLDRWADEVAGIVQAV
jgi:1,2-diacylglycerol 3-alpha-glucosyltransferase